MKTMLSRLTATAIIIATCTMLAFAEDAKELAIKKDRQLMEGTWKVVTVEVNGAISMAEEVKKFTVTNEADGKWILFTDGKEICRGTSTIDPSSKIKTIEFTITEGSGSGNRYHGIYEISKNNRKMCFGPADKTRPSEFKTTDDSGYILLSSEREKPKQ